MPAFRWDARVRLGFGLSLGVRDELRDGAGSGELRLFGWTMAGDAGTREMHSGALHRYLAEAVWYPAALLPSERLSWQPCSANAAIATLRDGGAEVALEFRFTAEGDVESIYTPARWGKFGKGYRALPWEGLFAAYADRRGVRVPLHGDVGWYDDGILQPVWKARILEWQMAAGGA